MFAVGQKQLISDAVTYQGYRDKMAAMMDATFPNRSTLVQGGVDDVASHLAPVDPAAPDNALVVFPEETGLYAAFIGTRGATARLQASAPAAIVTLLGTYATPLGHYTTTFPNEPLLRYLVLALTDTIYRAVYETFRDLAITHGVYLAVSANLAPARRVEQADDPVLVALLRDPDEPTRTYAYEAISPRPVNMAWVFAPDGEILVPDGAGGTRKSPSETDGILYASTDKAYLTPIEQPPPGEPAGLALSFGAVRDMEVLDTPVGKLAIVISKDAWMVDVNDRFVAKGANVILQPEAFDSWSFDTTEWSPDVFKEGGFANLQKNPEWVANLNASITGNLFDITFDGQTAVIGRRHKGPTGPLTASNAWIGQNPDTGFRAVVPWMAADPGITTPSLSLAARRAALAGDGALLLPGSGVPCADPLFVGPCDNGYREGIAWADVDVPTSALTGSVDPVREAPPAFEAAIKVSGAEPTPVAQHAPRIATRGRHVYVVWHQDDGAGSAVYLAASHDRGQTFGAPIKVSDRAFGTATELNPAIAIRGGRVLVVWQDFETAGNDDSGRIMLARFATSGVKRWPDVRVDDHPGVGKWMPQIAFVGSRPLVVWIDERDTNAEGDPLEHVYVARGIAGGRIFEPSIRVDGGAPEALAAYLDNKWSPTIATMKKEVYIAWADFRNYQWDIFFSRSEDGGVTFGPNMRVDDFPDYERVNERPTIALERGGIVHVAWTDLRAREADTNIFYARSPNQGTSFEANKQLDDSRVGFDPDTATPSNQWYPTLAVDRGQLFTVWQDNRLGNNDLFFSQSANAGTTFGAAERVDDTGDGHSEQTRPSLALSGKSTKRLCHVVWEDDRDGTRDIYTARRSCTDLVF